MQNLGAAEQALVRQAAMLTMRADQLQAAIMRGEAVNPDELIRLNGSARRTLDRIRKREAPKDTGDLRGYLARKQGHAAA